VKIVTVVGARPQFIKAAALSRAIQKSYASDIEEILVHTGQHYDNNMSGMFFNELSIPVPKYNLGISNVSHGVMTGRMLEALESVLMKESPDCLLVYGDTNSTLAGALAAAKIRIPIVHVEAGLRSFNMEMPEEINRIIADRLSTLLFCPTVTAVNNLKMEGIVKGVHNVGDVMYDVALFYSNQAQKSESILSTLGMLSQDYVLVTCHREENTNARERLIEILSALNCIADRFRIIFPLHPRTRKVIEKWNLFSYLNKLTVIEPLPFLDMIVLEKNATTIITDSGGIQKEAFFYRVPCLTMRDDTEWIETIDAGANILVGANSESIRQGVESLLRGEWKPNFDSRPYGDGQASQAVISLLLSKLG